MATQARRPGAAQSRFTRPLVPILVVLAVGILFLFIGSFIAPASASYRGIEAAPFDPVKMIPYLVVGAVIAYGVGVLAGDKDLWTVGTREVVYMAIGAALYGVLSWATNIIQLPSVALVSLRPAIVIPIFFGVVFGPAVGFFSGFVGNILGDAITGWGVFPIWDIGNGLIGLVAGLSVAFANRKRGLDVLVILVGAVGVILTILILLNPTIVDPNGDGTATIDISGTWWLPLLGVAIAIGLRYALRGREDIGSAQLWGALGIIVGIGFASLADIWWNGYSFLTALLGEFVPAGGSDLINGLILLPILLVAWKTAQAQTGR
ncbi:MAG TPA: ECF transporter S component [Roseiflexaceae bacterium]